MRLKVSMPPSLNKVVISTGFENQLKVWIEGELFCGWFIIVNKVITDAFGEWKAHRLWVWKFSLRVESLTNRRDLGRLAEVVFWFLTASDFFQTHLLVVWFMWDYRSSYICVFKLTWGILALCDNFFIIMRMVCLRGGDLHISIGDSNLLESHMALMKLIWTPFNCQLPSEYSKKGKRAKLTHHLEWYTKNIGPVYSIGLELSSYEGRKAAFFDWGWDCPYCHIKSIFLQSKWCHWPD